MNQFLLLSTSILVIVFTSLVSVPGSPYLINGTTQADISAKFPTEITPSGITFAIWSLIYISWIIAGIYVAFFGKKENKKYTNALFAYILAIFLTAIWLIPWGYEKMGIALFIILLILGLLKYAYEETRKSSPFLRWSIELTLGWINIATVANITVWLVSLGFRGGIIPEVYWAIGVLCLALLLTIYYQYRYQSYIISLVFLWTLFGEWLAHTGFEQRSAVEIYACIVILHMGYSFLKKK